jgi:hypothetical protein
VETLERDSGGLSEEQRNCVFFGFLDLDPEVLDAVRAEASGGASDEELTKKLGLMVRGCGVRVGG